MSKIKSPTEKKKAAYQRDHFGWSEYPHRFRVTWPRKKAAASRAYRRTTSQRLSAAQYCDLQVAGELDVDGIRRRIVRKWGASTLRDRVSGKISHRLRRYGAKRQRRERRLKRQ
jgi:hypothetical protein